MMTLQIRHMWTWGYPVAVIFFILSLTTRSATARDCYHNHRVRHMRVIDDDDVTEVSLALEHGDVASRDQNGSASVTDIFGRKSPSVKGEIRTLVNGSVLCQGGRHWLGVHVQGRDVVRVRANEMRGVVCAWRVVSFDLSGNRLDSVPDTLTEPLNNLLHLNLSFNRLKRLSARLLPDSLVTLDISHNSLTFLPSALLYHTHCLTNLHVAHNQIHTIHPNVFPTKLWSLRYADFSFNRLTVFEPWPYFFHMSVHVDLSHNFISRFSNSVNFTLRRELYRAVINLTHNNISYLTPHDFSIYHQGRVPTGVEIYNHWLVLENNPWVCDCRMYDFIHLLKQTYMQAWVFDGHSFTCVAPPALRGRSLEFLVDHAPMLVCQVRAGCPEGCRCMDTPHHGHLLVSCDPQLRTYARLPEPLPGDGLLALHLSGHALTHLAGGEGPDIGRLKELDVSHNQVAQVSASFLVQATQLRVLNLRHNRLTSLPSDLQRLPVSDLHLADNPLQCSCDLVTFGNWAKAMTANFSDSSIFAELHGVKNSTHDKQTNVSISMWNYNTFPVHKPRPNFTTPQPIPDALIVMCSLPDGRKLGVVDTNQWGLSCESRVAMHVLIVSGVLVVMLVVVVLVVCLRWRYLCHVLFNAVRLKLSRAVQNPQAGDTTPATSGLYDVYISLDEEDDVSVRWVTQVLLPILNKGGNFLRLYLPLRDELAGANKAESRAEKIECSDKVLVILSPRYIHNGWCRFELDLACQHLKSRPRHLVPLITNDNDVPVTTTATVITPAGQDGHQRRTLRCKVDDKFVQYRVEGSILCCRFGGDRFDMNPVYDRVDVNPPDRKIDDGLVYDRVNNSNRIEANTPDRIHICQQNPDNRITDSLLYDRIGDDTCIQTGTNYSEYIQILNKTDDMIGDNPPRNRISAPTHNGITRNPHNRLDNNPPYNRIDDNPPHNRIDSNPLHNRIDNNPSHNRIDSNPAHNRVDNNPSHDETGNKSPANRLQYRIAENPLDNKIEVNSFQIRIEKNPLPNRIKDHPLQTTTEDDSLQNEIGDNPLQDRMEDNPLQNRIDGSHPHNRTDADSPDNQILPSSNIKISRRQKKSNQKEDRQRRLEELSQYWEDEHLRVVEPLRSFLLEGRYVLTSGWLWQHSLLFELCRRGTKKRNERMDRFV